MKKKLPIGSKIIYKGKAHTLLGYYYDGYACVIEGSYGKHEGDMSEYWHDENGNPIPYVKGDNRYYVVLRDIKPVKEKPEFIFEI